MNERERYRVIEEIKGVLERHLVPAQIAEGILVEAMHRARLPGKKAKV